MAFVDVQVGAAFQFGTPLPLVIPTPAGAVGDAMYTFLGEHNAAGLLPDVVSPDWTFGGQISFVGGEAIYVYTRTRTGLEAASYSWNWTVSPSFRYVGIALDYSNTPSAFVISGVTLLNQTPQPLVMTNPLFAGAVNAKLVYAWIGGLTGGANTPTIAPDVNQTVRATIADSAAGGNELRMTVADEDVVAANSPARTATFNWPVDGSNIHLAAARINAMAPDAPVVTSAPGFGFGSHPFGP